MIYKVKLTRLAEQDACNAYEYVRESAPYIADKWLNKLFDAIMSLEYMPNRCPLIPEADELEYPAHHLIFGNKSTAFRIIFDINVQSDEPCVRILRIWRGSRDILKSEDITIE